MAVAAAWSRRQLALSPSAASNDGVLLPGITMSGGWLAARGLGACSMPWRLRQLPSPSSEGSEEGNSVEVLRGGFDTLSRPIAVGVVILITYLLAVLANMINIMFIISDKRLHKPMYLLICNLAVVDIVYTSSSSPTMIGVLLAGVNTISYVAFVPLPHCSSRLKYSFCDFAAVIRTTCVNPEKYFNEVSIAAFFIFFFTFIFICLSYCGILLFVKLSSNNEKMKMGSTLVSHLICVVVHYCPAFVRIMFTRFGVVLTLEERQGLVIGAVLGPCLVNPFVYCLRTKEIKQKLFKIFKKFNTSD
uniref:olfactory receptor 10R2-like n=1 Tax=Maylandia zebra TaxID=106582 RepID=UPI000C23D45E|nr:olfactory receptor 10R2-like [Maylandia zebra]